MPKNLTDIINLFTNIGFALVPLLGAVAFLIFVWGVARFIRSAGSEKEIGESKNLIIWGIVGIFVLVTIWGIVAFLQGEFGFGDKPFIPQIPTKL